jgi:hypothetical protein
MAALLIAALGASMAPRPAAAAAAPCHMPVSAQTVSATPQHGGQQCSHCGQTSCLAMPGCVHVVAVAVAPAPTSSLSQQVVPVRLEEPRARDIAPSSPPTPPPNC